MSPLHEFGRILVQYQQFAVGRYRCRQMCEIARKNQVGLGARPDRLRKIWARPVFEGLNNIRVPSGPTWATCSCRRMSAGLRPRSNIVNIHTSRSAWNNMRFPSGEMRGPRSGRSEVERHRACAFN